eukprot:12971298-Heterocapsa_arctica.AAC.1
MMTKGNLSFWLLNKASQLLRDPTCQDYPNKWPAKMPGHPSEPPHPRPNVIHRNPSSERGNTH